MNSKTLTDRLKLQHHVLHMYDVRLLGHIETTLNEEISPRELIRPTWGLMVEMAHYVDLANKE